MREENKERRASSAVLAVGCRVSVRRQAEAPAAGTIVEDFAELTESEERGHDWAPVHRWAIALDDGRLVFANTDDLTADPGTPPDHTQLSGCRPS